jgi:dTDP-4-amino-4,6-dideoxygalactose transaminase
MKIKFNDIYQQDKVLLPSIFRNIKKIIKNTDFILGDEVNKFEKNFSKFVGTKYCISCANGTDALYLTLKSLNLRKDDEVIVPAMTYVATASAVINAGYKLRLADVNINDGSIDQNDVLKKINKNTKAIIFVNLWGHCSNYSKLKKICDKRKIILIEDAAQSIGAKNSENIKSGKIGHIACFSFFPGKNLGAYGDGGAIVTDNKKIYNIISKLHINGAKNKFEYDLIGINSRLDTIQACVLNFKLKRINKLNNLRRKIAKFYDKNLLKKKIKTFSIQKNSCFHQYVLLVDKRKKFTDYLKKNKIPFGYHYPYSIDKLNSFKKLYNDKNLKISNNIATKCVSLPIHPNLKLNELIYIVKKINQFQLFPQ